MQDIVFDLGKIISENLALQIVSIIIGVVLYLYKDEIKGIIKSRGIFKEIARVLKLSEQVREDLETIKESFADGKIDAEELIKISEALSRLLGEYDDFEKKNGDYIKK